MTQKGSLHEISCEMLLFRSVPQAAIYHASHGSSCPRPGELSFTADFKMLFIVNLELIFKLFPTAIHKYNCEQPYLDLTDVLDHLAKNHEVSQVQVHNTPDFCTQFLDTAEILYPAARKFIWMFHFVKTDLNLTFFRSEGGFA